ncbi:MAG: TonB-dependent receptor [Bacteroidota bacterium]
MIRLFRLGIFALAALFVADAALAQQRGQRRQLTPEQMERLARGVISGQVLDDETGEPIVTAAVAIWRVRDSTLVTGGITNAEGQFNIEGLLPGRYWAHISFLGYASQDLEDIALNPRGGSMTADLGAVRLVVDAAALDEVEVTAERELLQIGIDRTVYNTKDQPAFAGGNASEVLQNIPSIEVDIDGNVSLRGNQNVAIQINGRPVQMNGEMLAGFLQSLPADAVERVEVIPNPSARYEPDGMSGIINIVLAQDAEIGISGGITAGFGTLGDYNASGNIGIGKGPLNARVNYGFRNNARPIDGALFRENRFRDPLTFLEQDDDGDRGGFSHVLGTDIDYRLTKSSTLSFSGLVSLRNGDNASRELFTELDAGRDVTRSYIRSNDDDGEDLRMDYTLAFKRTITPREHELNVEARWESEWEDDFGTFLQEDLAGTSRLVTANEQESEDEQTHEGSFQVDYFRPLLGGKFETGYRGSLRRLDNNFFAAELNLDSQVLDPRTDLNNDFIYDEQVHAVYGIMNREFGKLGIQAGVRLEQALTDFDLRTTNETFDNDYFSVFPSAFLTYSLSETRSLRASYSKRINRPRTRQLNPFVSISDPLNLRVGNPRLLPEYVHSIEASFVQFTRSASLTLTPYYRYTTDVIERIQTIDDVGVTTLTFENFSSNDSYGAEVIGSYRRGQRFSSFVNFNAYRVVTNADNVDGNLSNNAIGWSARINGSFTLRDGLALQAFYFYRAPLDIGQGRIDAFQFANLSIRQQFAMPGGQGSLSLRANDIFDTMGFSLWRDAPEFYQSFDRRWGARAASLVFTYNFGEQDRNDRRRSRGDGEGFGGGDMEMGE